MVRFCSPYNDPEADPVTLGPFKEVEINDRTLIADGATLGYCSGEDDVVWNRNGREYDSVKIFAAPNVVSGP